MGPFQTTVRASAISASKSSIDFGPMASAIHRQGKAPSPVWTCVLASCANLSASLWSTGSRKRTPFCSAFARAAYDIQLVEFDERLADVLSARLQEGVGHAATDDNGVDLFEQVVDDLDLVGDLGATDDGDEGLVRLHQRFAHVGELFFHQQPSCGLLDEVGDAFGGSVGAVRGAEGVVDIDIAE